MGRRSLSGIPFPPSINLEERRLVEDLVGEGLSSLKGGSAGHYYPCHGSTSHGEATRTLMHRPRLGAWGITMVCCLPHCLWLWQALSASGEDAIRAQFHLYVNQRTAYWQCGELGREWPDGRGLFTSADKAVIGWTNEEEHFQLLAVDYEGGIERVCTRLWEDLGADLP